MAQITSLDQLQTYYKAPHPIVMNKSVYAIEQHTQTFIEHSPFVVISTQNSEGGLDVSPRGGAPGFIKILNSQTLIFGDHAGNNRLDTLRNLLHNPQVGVLFTIPGIHEIVRLKGTATLHDDPELLERCDEHGKLPKLVVKIQIQELFFHCPKAMLTSKIWQPEAFTSRDILPNLGQIIKDQLGLESLE